MYVSIYCEVLQIYVGMKIIVHIAIAVRVLLYY